ncbi:TM2 domain-containing protein [Bacillus sp. BHET2]|uniref:TM2 domain-containing protein n=1 Tax=Bacillus sp. BHET2 TaxID=2583818 RepID=UPI00110D758E|nr:TM2 domain-containing protein [Bacillus sp. BHET2]TMU83450.1 TM2 domain-containing protein [Bacillus sp. BHET2]
MDSVSKFDLTIEELAILESEMLKKRKNKEAAWGLWAGLSFFGAHRFYTENYRYASTMLLTSMVPIIAIIIILSTVEYYNGFIQFLLGLFIFLLSGSVVWSWIDAFFLNRRIIDINESCENHILQTIINSRK